MIVVLLCRDLDGEIDRIPRALEELQRVLRRLDAAAAPTAILLTSNSTLTREENEP